MSPSNSLRMKFLLLALLLGVGAPAHAAFEDIGIGPRVSGMGNGFVAVADDVHSIYYNPAGLGSLIGTEFTSSYSRLFMGLDDGSSIGQSALGYAQPLKQGNWGAFGLGWTQLELSGLYREQTIYLAYGKLVARELWGGSLLFGGALKQLSRSLSVPANPDGSTLFDRPVDNNGGQFGGAQDDTLSKPSNSAMDADIGFLFPFKRRFAVGLQINHAMSPNVGFKGSDKLAMGQKLGFAYRGPLTKLTLELQRAEGAVIGKTVQTFVLGGERWIKTEKSGDFAVRTGLGVGGSSFRQFSMGLGYRFTKLQIDYAFTIPIGGISGTTGHQRFALSFRFGGKDIGEETAGERALRELKGLGGLEPTTFEERLQVTKERQEASKLYQKAQGAIQEGQFSKAVLSMTEAIRKDPSIPGVGEYFRRLSFVSESIPELTELNTKARTFVFNGILDFLGLKDDDAMRKIAYGVSLNPQDAEMEDFLIKLEKFTGMKAEKVQGKTDISLVDQKLTESLMAFRERKYGRVITLTQEVLALEPENLPALKRLGSALYVTRDYEKAAAILQKAYDLESNEKEKRTLKKYLDLANEKLKAQGPAVKPAEGEAPAETTTP